MEQFYSIINFWKKFCVGFANKDNISFIEINGVAPKWVLELLYLFPFHPLPDKICLFPFSLILVCLDREVYFWHFSSENGKFQSSSMKLLKLKEISDSSDNCINSRKAYCYVLLLSSWSGFGMRTQLSSLSFTPSLSSSSSPTLPSERNKNLSKFIKHIPQKRNVIAVKNDQSVNFTDKGHLR